MEKSGFFNSNNGDRIYDATDFASYFGDLIGNGIFRQATDSLKIIAHEGMSVIARPGSGWINGYHYQNTMPLELTIPTAHGINPRIDRVVLRWDNVARAINLAVKAGIPAATPMTPDLDRNADIYELGIADILVERGSISILASAITDTRANPILCGWVSSFDGLDDIVEDLRRDIGNLSELETDVKSSLVNAVNEIKSRIDTFSPSPEVENIPLYGEGNVITTGSSASIENNGSSRYLRIQGRCQINNVGNDGTHPIWEIGPLPSNVISLSTNGDRLAIGTQVGHIVKVDAISGSTIWTHNLPAGLLMSRISNQGNIYAMTNSSDIRDRFFKLSAGDGDVMWNRANGLASAVDTTNTVTEFVLDDNENLHFIGTFRGPVPASTFHTRRGFINSDNTESSVASFNLGTRTANRNVTLNRGLVLDAHNRLFYYVDAASSSGSGNSFNGIVRDTDRLLSGFSTSQPHAYHRGLIFGSNFITALSAGLTSAVIRRDLNAAIVETLPITHDVSL